MYSDASDNHCCKSRRSEARGTHHRNRRHHRSPTVPACKSEYSVSGRELLVLVNERFQTVIDYRSCRLIHKSQRYDDDMTSDIQKMRKKVTVRIEDEASNVKDSIFRTTLFHWFQNSMWFFVKRWTRHNTALSRIYGQSYPCRHSGALGLLSDSVNSCEWNITTYAEVLNSLRRRSATIPVSSKGEKKIGNYKQYSLAFWIFPEVVRFDPKMWSCLFRGKT